MINQCSSCGGFCKKSGCERENVKPTPQRKPLTDEEADGVALDVMGFAVLEKEQAETALMLIRATEVAHNIKE